MTPPEGLPSQGDFATAYESGGALVWSRRVSDLETPVSALLKLGADKPGSFLLESVQGGDFRGRYSIIGVKPDLVWRVKDGRAQTSRGGFSDAAFRPQREAPLNSLRKLLACSALGLPDDMPPMAAGLFGYLGYDMVRLMERLPDAAPDPTATPDALLVRPTIVAVFDNVTSEITLVTPARKRASQTTAQALAAAQTRLDRVWRALSRPLSRRTAPKVETATIQPKSNTSPDEYRAMVERCKAYTRAGDVFQVVPSQRFSAPFAAPAFALYRALRRLNPSPFLYYLNFADFCVVGSSPEILVRLRGETVTIRPIAGTRPRGATPAEDQALEQDLLADPKERAEHLMLVDLARNDLGRVAKRGGGSGGNNAAAAGAGSRHVRVTEAFTIERYSHVMHIVSNVEGELREGLAALDALMAGFPHGTVTGAPKVRAMEIINEVEKHKRGIYAGGVGYFGAGGDMDTCIALRTGIVKDGMLHVQAGGGVVLDSDAEAEFQETLHKSRALFRAASEAWRYG